MPTCKISATGIGNPICGSSVFERHIPKREGLARGRGEAFSTNGGYQPARTVYGLSLETSNDMMPPWQKAGGVEKEKDWSFLFSFPLLPLRPPAPVQAKFEGRGIRGVIP